LVICISLVYSATRFESWRLILVQSVRWAVYIVTFLGGVYALLFLVHWLVNPYWIIAAAAVLFGVFFFSGRSREKSADKEKVKA
jgi:nitrate/nitrite-specific signal transduction histidine kinase